MKVKQFNIEEMLVRINYKDRLFLKHIIRITLSY